jgi:hypothetical protein
MDLLLLKLTKVKEKVVVVGEFDVRNKGMGKNIFFVNLVGSIITINLLASIMQRRP